MSMSVCECERGHVTGFTGGMNGCMQIGYVS